MSVVLSIQNGRFILGDTDTDKRYVREVALASDVVMTMVQGPSLTIATRPGGSVFTGYVWRWEVGAATYSGGTATTHPATGFTTSRKIAL